MRLTCNGYRNPALLAKIASTVDVLWHGRLTFGIGAGWYEHEYLAYGYQYPDAPTRLGYLQPGTLVYAHYADACNVGNLEPEAIARKFAILHKHCQEVGRDYDTIHRTIMLNCSIAQTDEQALERAQATNFARNTGGPEHLRTRALVGTPETIRKRLAAYEQSGAQEVIFYFPAPQRLESLRLFAKEVMGK